MAAGPSPPPLPAAPPWSLRPEASASDPRVRHPPPPSSPRAPPLLPRTLKRRGSAGIPWRPRGLRAEASRRAPRPGPAQGRPQRQERDSRRAALRLPRSPAGGMARRGERGAHRTSCRPAPRAGSPAGSSPSARGGARGPAPTLRPRPARRAPPWPRPLAGPSGCLPRLRRAGGRWARHGASWPSARSLLRRASLPEGLRLVPVPSTQAQGPP